MLKEIKKKNMLTSQQNSLNFSSSYGPYVNNV